MGSLSELMTQIEICLKSISRIKKINRTIIFAMCRNKQNVNKINKAIKAETLVER